MDTISIGDISGMPGPKYRAVAELIQAAISDGRLTPGDKLPPVRDLAWELKITPGTVARAYSVLTDKGVLHAEVGRGTFVAGQEAPARPEPRLHIRNPPRETGIVSLFSPHLPDVGQVGAIRRALREVAESEATDLLNYPSARASDSARQAAARWLSTAQLGPVDPEQLVFTHGGQNAVSLVMQCVLRGRRPVILVEELSYPGFRRAAELLRAEVVPVPMDAQGIIPEELDRLARTHAAQLLCTSPEVQSPTCLHTPLARREAIAEVARARGFQILEDDCYRLAEARQPGYRMLLPEQTWYIASISKQLTPALRVGFAVAPRDSAAALRRAAEYGFFGLSTPLAETIGVLLGAPSADRLAADVRAEVGRYIRAGVNALGSYDLTWNADVPFFWLRLPEGWRVSAFCQAAEAQGLKIRSAEDFAMREARVPHAVRISINAEVSLAAFEDAMLRLRRLLDNPPQNIGV
ncbi:PLP-dependent aminotransferase family protein [Marinovum sp.]|uniref:aminotransferase-like domain-containing protein n=1 Tax=Marinovum sp. TaxID=2024839 RepID=UPI002B26E199|nr:PLP-dependent aminotransferase family protein [Marinovum sp.]